MMALWRISDIAVDVFKLLSATPGMIQFENGRPMSKSKINLEDIVFDYNILCEKSSFQFSIFLNWDSNK